METFTALLTLCVGNSPVTGEFPTQRPVTRSCFLWSAPWINGWLNNRDAGDLRRHHAHYDVIVMRGDFLGFYILPGCMTGLRAITLLHQCHWRWRIEAERKWTASCNDISKRIFVNETGLISIQISQIFFLEIQHCEHWSANGLAPKRRQAIMWSNGSLIRWRINASLDVS